LEISNNRVGKMHLKIKKVKKAAVFFVSALFIMLSMEGYAQVSEELLPGQSKVTLSVENMT